MNEIDDLEYRPRKSVDSQYGEAGSFTTEELIEELTLAFMPVTGAKDAIRSRLLLMDEWIKRAGEIIGGDSDIAVCTQPMCKLVAKIANAGGVNEQR